MPNRSSGEKTKIILAESLRRLMKKKPLDKIKIREIVEECGLNRQTFYYHFQDIYALLEWMYQYDGEQIIKNNFKTGDLFAVSKAMIGYIEEHREELISVIESKAEVYFLDYLYNGVGQCFDIIIGKRTSSLSVSAEYRKFLNSAFTNAVVGIIHDWIMAPESNRMSCEQLMEMFEIASKGIIKLAVNNYLKSIEE